MPGVFCIARWCATQRASHRMWRVNRTFDHGFAPQKQKPARGGFFKYGARTRTKMPGAFLHRALVRDPEGEPQDVASESNLR